MIKGFNYVYARKLMDEKKLTYSDLINFFYDNGVEMKLNAVQSWFRKDDKTRTLPDIKKIGLVSEFLKTPINDLISGNNTKYASVKFVSVVGEASCGEAITNSFQDIGRKALYNGDFWNENLYCVIASGDSMSPDIDDGDEVICDPEAEITNGDIVHYTIDNESAIKVFFNNKDLKMYELIPYNQTEKFKTRYIKKDADFTMHKVVSVNKLRLNNRKARLRMVGKA